MYHVTVYCQTIINTKGKSMSVFLTVRMEQEALDEFRKYCSEKLQRRHSNVVRELVIAATEGRVKITPTDAMKEMYHDN
jgi:hypothetical protein